MSDNNRYVAKWYEPREYPKEFFKSKSYKRFVKTQKNTPKRENEVSGFEPCKNVYEIVLSEYKEKNQTMVDFLK